MTYRPEVIAFPDVEAIVRSHLEAQTGETVTTGIPNPRPARFVRVLRTGGPRTGLVTERPQVTVECWANDSVAAAQLARTVRAHLGAMTGRVPGVSGVQEASGPQNLPDPTSKQARYTWTVTIDVRGHAI